MDLDLTSMLFGAWPEKWVLEICQQWFLSGDFLPTIPKPTLWLLLQNFPRHLDLSRKATGSPKKAHYLSVSACISKGYVCVQELRIDVNLLFHPEKSESYFRMDEIEHVNSLCLRDKQ